MTVWLLCALVGVSWTFVHVLDFVLRRLKNRRYENFVEKTGLLLGFLHARLYIFKGDRLDSFQRRRPRAKSVRSLLHCWFSVGVAVSVLMGILAVRLFLLHVFYFFYPPAISFEDLEVNGDSPGALTAVIPGITMPLSQAPVLFVVLTLCALCHELGHAVAAFSEDVNVDGFGLLAVVLYPGAFTDLNSYDMTRLDCWRKLKIYSAGVWHNVCLAALAFAALHFFTSCASTTLVIDNVSEAPMWIMLSGNWAVGKSIYSVNNCPVQCRTTWLNCLNSVERSAVTGLCVGTADVKGGCDDGGTGFVDFRVLPNSNSSSGCMDRRLLTFGAELCDEEKLCPVDKLCVYPGSRGRTHLINILFNDESDILLVGSSEQMAKALKLNEAFITSGWLFENFTQLLQMTVTFSFAFAVLNSVPCYGLDGQFLSESLIRAVLPFNSHLTELLCKLVCAVGTAVILFSVIVALAQQAVNF